MELQWLPAHCGVASKDAADKAASSAPVSVLKLCDPIHKDGCGNARIECMKNPGVYLD